MSIYEISKGDSVVGTIVGINSEKGTAFLKISNLVTENNVQPLIIVHNFYGYGRKGDKVLVSIAKVSDYNGYIKCYYDSDLDRNDNCFAA